MCVCQVRVFLVIMVGLELECGAGRVPVFCKYCSSYIIQLDNELALHGFIKVQVQAKSLLDLVEQPISYQGILMGVCIQE